MTASKETESQNGCPMVILLRLAAQWLVLRQLFSVLCSIAQIMKGFRGRVITSWAVVTETLHMLDFNVNSQLDLLRWLERDSLAIPDIWASDVAFKMWTVSELSVIPC